MTEIKLIQLQAFHLEEVRLWRMSREVSQYMYTDPILTPEGQKEWFEKNKFDKTKRNWIVNVDGIDVGLVSLYDIDQKNKRCFWAYYLAAPSVRGKGVGGAIELNILKYVFEVINLNKLCCEVLAFNTKVIDIHKKYGSTIEGIFRDHVLKNNQFYDVVRLAILKSEWENEIKYKFKVPFIEISPWTEYL